MKEQWEMCIISENRTPPTWVWSKDIYSPDGMESTPFSSLQEKNRAIQALLLDGWEPFAASEAMVGNISFRSNLYFRRRIS
jgi:hypothetical protein